VIEEILAIYSVIKSSIPMWHSLDGLPDRFLVRDYSISFGTPLKTCHQLLPDPKGTGSTMGVAIQLGMHCNTRM